MQLPRVSIIITAFNVARYIADTVDAALAQTQPGCEVIVVNDGSTDETAEILARYGDAKRRGSTGTWGSGSVLRRRRPDGA